MGWDEEPPRCEIVDLRIPPRKGKVYFFEVNLDFGLSKNIRKCCKLNVKKLKNIRTKTIRQIAHSRLTVSKLHLIDLAGSERQKATGEKLRHGVLKI